MKFFTFSSLRRFSYAIPPAAGFFAGAVFGSAFTEPKPHLSPAFMLVSGFVGAALLTALWLTVSFLIAIKTGKGKLARRLSVWFGVGMLPLISFSPYLIHRSGLNEISEELPPLGARYAATTLMLLSLLLIFVLLRLVLTRGKNSKIYLFLTSHPVLTLTFMAIAWLAVFLPMDVLKNQYMQVTTVNSAAFHDGMTHVFDSRGFMYSSLIYGSGASLFAVHINAVLLLILPLFRLWPDPRSLLFISDVALAASVFPLYLIARMHFSKGLSLLLALMLILHPTLTAQPGRSDFSELRFMPVLFLTAVYLFEKKRFWWFMGICALMMTIREDMGIFVAFFGIYALIRHYPRRWVLSSLGAGLAAFLFLGAALLPHLSPGDSAIRVSVRYSHLGSSGSDIVKTIFFRPWKIFQAAFAGPSHIGVAYGIFLTFGLGIAFLSGAIILAIPAVAELMLQNTTNFATFMALPTVPIMMVAFIYGLDRFDRIVTRRWKIDAGRVALITATVMFFLSISAFHTWFNPDMYRPRYNYDAAIKAFNMVPDNAKLMMPEYMLADGKPNQTLRGFHQVVYQNELKGKFNLTEDYVIIDRRIPNRDAGNQYYRGLAEVTNLLNNSSNFTCVFSQNDIELWIRNRIVFAKEPLNNVSIKPD
jgi:uncharacterized membrane protein